VCWSESGAVAVKGAVKRAKPGRPSFQLQLAGSATEPAATCRWRPLQLQYMDRCLFFMQKPPSKAPGGQEAAGQAAAGLEQPKACLMTRSGSNRSPSTGHPISRSDCRPYCTADTGLPEGIRTAEVTGAVQITCFVLWSIEKGKEHKTCCDQASATYAFPSAFMPCHRHRSAPRKKTFHSRC
jgi:hypothetical protein